MNAEQKQALLDKLARDQRRDDAATFERMQAREFRGETLDDASWLERNYHEPKPTPRLVTKSMAAHAPEPVATLSDDERQGIMIDAVVEHVADVIAPLQEQIDALRCDLAIANATIKSNNASWLDKFRKVIGNNS